MKKWMNAAPPLAWSSVVAVPCLSVGMAPRMMGILLALVLGLLPVRAQTPAPTVAVLDFLSPGEGNNQWTWAEGALADCLQMELDRFGLMTLDRDLIHAVLAEQKLNALNLTAANQIQVGSLLQARYLVTGKLIPLGNDRVRVEATAFSVEAVETVSTATAEGELPKDLSSLMNAVAKQIAGKLNSSPATPATPRENATAAPKPEALILFYRGLNACAQGCPELAAPWFINAANLDTQFTAPLLWEIKAYEMAGFGRHAAIRRDEVETVLKQQGLTIADLGEGGNRSSNPVLAVLTPLIPSSAANRETATAAIASVLKQALGESGRARLFAYENLGQAVAEQDLKLSSFFARQHAPRYGRWLAVDGLVSLKMEWPAPGLVSLDLSLIHPFTSAILNRIQRSGSAEKQTEVIRAAARELVEGWKKVPSNPILPIADMPAISVDDRIAGLRPAFKSLALALAKTRREPAKSENHQSLANAFCAAGRLRLAAVEIERCIDLLDIRAPNADKTYLGVHRWLYWSGPISPCIAAGLVDNKTIDRLIRPLLDTYPQSLAAGCLHYNLAVSAWQSGSWQLAVEHAPQARKIIKPTEQHPELELELVAATFFLEGASRLQLLQTNAAAAILHEGLDYMRKHSVRDECLPYGPMIGGFFGVDSVEGYGGDPPGIRQRIQMELESLAGEPVRPTAMYFQQAADKLVSATNAPSRTKEEWIGCVRQIAQMLNRAPAGDTVALKAIASSASSGLTQARDKNATDAELRPLAQQCATSYLDKQTQKFREKINSDSIDKLTEHINDALFLFGCIGMQDEVWDVLSPYFSDAYPVELGLKLIPQLTWDRENRNRELCRIAGRLNAGPASASSSSWLALAQLYSSLDRFPESLECYRKAKSLGDSRHPGLSLVFIELALERDPAHPAAEMERLAREFGLAQIEVSWVEWFALGRKYQTARQFDIHKAIASYQNMLDFLDHPEKSGFHHLEKLPGKDRFGLRWGDGVNDQDRMWSQNYDGRWLSAAYFLSQCLIEVDQREEAAHWLRQIALKAGGDKVELLLSASWHGSSCGVLQLGVQATEMLKNLHDQSPHLSFGQTDGPYKLPAMRHRNRPRPAPPWPAVDPAILSALTNVLVEWSSVRPQKFQHPLLEDFVSRHGHAAVPALMRFINRSEWVKNGGAAVWMLEKTAQVEDLPWLLALCSEHSNVIPIVARLAPQEAAEIILNQWHPFEEMAPTQSALCFHIITARLRALYPLVTRYIAEGRMSHLGAIIRFDPIVKEENSSELTAAFCAAVGSCIDLKLQKKDVANLDRISKIALQHGARGAIEGLLACQGMSQEQLLKELRPCVDLPPQDTEALSMLRVNSGKWEWSPRLKKYISQAR